MTNDSQFGYTHRQLNLAASRIQQGMSRFEQPNEAETVRLNVASSDDEEMFVPIDTKSLPALLVLLLEIVAANNLALDKQLRELGLAPRNSALLPPIYL